MLMLALVSWIVTCEALRLHPVCSSNITDKHSILKQALSEIDPSEFDFQWSPEDLETYTAELQNEDIDLNITQLISKYNYPVEEHQVMTSDGYILTVIRMPKQGKPVFLMHGLVCSADDFVTVNLPNAIAYNLWLDGYDVWMGNARGNKYSRKHVSLDPDKDREFWDFSWDEIGRIDLPTMIDYVLHVTGESQIVYIGHSQGTTSYLVMCSEKPEYNDKISLMISLSTVAWMSHIKSPLIRILSIYIDELEFLSKLLSVHELLPSNELTKTFTKLFCSEPYLAIFVCSNLMFSVAGFDFPQVDPKILPVIFGHIPSGASTMQGFHYLQEVRSGKFRKYDHGVLNNLVLYDSVEPPDYDVSKITSPIAIFYSDNDWLSNYTDVKILMNKLHNVVEVYRVPFANFSHLDYIFAKDLKTLVYDKVAELVRKYI